MAANVLKKITTRAKQIYKKGGTWKGAVKKAGAEYRSGKKSKPKKKTRRKVGGTLSGGTRPASHAVGKVRRRKRRVGATLSDSPRPAGNAIGRVSTASLISHAKERIGKEIGRAEVSKFKAKKVTQKRKIAKRITALKSKYRKLC